LVPRLSNARSTSNSASSTLSLIIMMLMMIKCCDHSFIYLFQLFRFTNFYLSGLLLRQFIFIHVFWILVIMLCFFFFHTLFTLCHFETKRESMILPCGCPLISVEYETLVTHFINSCIHRSANPILHITTFKKPHSTRS
jgi:hypothetical protein